MVGSESKLQSAMEYLMTYGWAILVIAIVIYAMFSIGLFNATTSSTCQAQAGFRCQNLVYSHATGNVMAVLGQAEQNTWYTTNVVYVEGENTNVSASYFNAQNEQVITTAMGINQPQTMTLPVITQSGNIIGPVAIGTRANGYIWAQYTTCTGSSCGSPGSVNNQYYYAMVARASVTAS